jgi:hypothetical protein
MYLHEPPRYTEAISRIAGRFANVEEETERSVGGYDAYVAYSGSYLLVLSREVFRGAWDPQWVAVPLK